MCGIHLIIDKKNSACPEAIQKMLLHSHHRGPDAKGYLVINFKNQTLYIGNNRLKINDLSDSANMPFISEDGNYIISFNGEIYNYPELKKKLEHKYFFKTNSDTEVLLYWLIEYGEPGIKQLNGMFSFIFIDKIKEKIWLARDKMGMKPLYYFDSQDFQIFSSETKSIIASGLAEKIFNQSQISHFLQFRYCKSPQTFFKNIFEIENGKLFEIRENGMRPVYDYLSYLPEKSPGLDLEELLFSSVKDYFVSNAPIGLFLSGGVDSTLLLALIQKAGFKNIPCFCIANDNITKDTHYARKAARQYGGDYNQVEIDKTVLKDFKNFISSVDQPIADVGAWSTSLLSGAANRQGLKVIFSGAGADELFGGYNRHSAFKMYLKYNNLINENLIIIKKVRDFLPKNFRHFHKFITQLQASPRQSFVNFTSLLSVFENATHTNIEEIFEKDIIKWALDYDRDNYLCEDVLKITDQMSMQHGVEVRLPFLDQKIINYTNDLSGDDILKRGKKWLLKKILSEMGGNIYTKRKKEGLGFPFANWLFEAEGEEIMSNLQNSNTAIYQYLPFENIQNVLNIHKSKKMDYSSEIFAIALLAMWTETNF